MTDADVDGAHIATLLMTLFYKQMPELISSGHLYIALPPLFKISGGGRSFYAKDEKELEEIISKEFKNKKYEVSRFKGLGEMNADQLKDTTMNPKTRTLIRVTIPSRTEEDIEDAERTKRMVEDLMGKNVEPRFKFISENARFAEKLI
jgi:topoisomerase-4 subunit B